MTIEENAEEQISNAELKLYNIADKGNETTGFGATSLLDTVPSSLQACCLPFGRQLVGS